MKEIFLKSNYLKNNEEIIIVQIAGLIARELYVKGTRSRIKTREIELG